MKFKLSIAYEGVVVRTRWKKWWHCDKSFVTGIVKFASLPLTTVEWTPPLLERAQIWYSPVDWVWIKYTCDMRTFKILSGEEAIIWKLEHNM